jgi:hypothetical protein
MRVSETARFSEAIEEKMSLNSFGWDWLPC